MKSKLENLAVEFNAPSNLNYIKENSTPFQDISFMFDYMFTPGSMIRFQRNNKPKKEENYMKYLNYGLASIGEVYRGAIYVMLTTIVSPLIPIMLTFAGLFGYLLNKKPKNQKNVQKRNSIKGC